MEKKLSASSKLDFELYDGILIDTWDVNELEYFDFDEKLIGVDNEARKFGIESCQKTI